MTVLSFILLGSIFDSRGVITIANMNPVLDKIGFQARI